MYAHDVHGYAEMYPYETHTSDTYAHEVHTREMHAREVHAL
jgi:hypothetical protein